MLEINWHQCQCGDDGLIIRLLLMMIILMMMVMCVGSETERFRQPWRFISDKTSIQKNGQAIYIYIVITISTRASPKDNRDGSTGVICHRSPLLPVTAVHF